MKKLFPKVVGILIILLSLFWLYQNMNLYYLYHYTDVLFAFRYPNWVLFFQVFLGVFNIFIGFKIFLKTISFKKGLQYFIATLFLGIFVEQFHYLF